jgi:Cellulase (glycosyl hydrolase family 5)
MNFKNTPRVWLLLIGLFSLTVACVNPEQPNPTITDSIRVASNGHGFVYTSSGKVFIPWGFNYDHDRNDRLIEAYWTAEWATVVEDFLEMKALGANVVRIHLQFGQFMTSPDQANGPALERLKQLVKLAESTGLYLDITGLGCYKKPEVPVWFDALTESQRWAAQAKFWGAIANAIGSSPAVFAYDLMNEPIVPDIKRPDGGWLTDTNFAGFYFVQYIVLDLASRDPASVARAWIQTMKTAIRAHDLTHLITVGSLPFSNGAGFVPLEVAKDLDYLSVHVYPQTGKVDASLSLLQSFLVGKPVVVEETSPLYSGFADFRDFLTRSKSLASGWIGFYWGKTLAELTPPQTIADGISQGWLEIFMEFNPNK